MADDFSISELIRNYREVGDFDRVPSYAELWRGCAEGRVPARRLSRGWQIARADRERAALALGLRRRQPTVAA
jgi:hypothetical protein